MTGSEDGKRTLASPLYTAHIDLGARFGKFGNAVVVNDYGVEVHEKLPLDHVLLTDLSFQGTLRVGGADATRFLHGMLTADIAGLPHVGSSCYSLMLTSDAHVIDVVFVIRTGDSEYMLVVDAPVIEECFEWLDNNSRIELEGERVFPDVEVEDQTGKLAMLCLMGSGTVETLEEVAGVPPAYVGHGESVLARELAMGLHFDSQIANVPMMMLSDPAVQGSVLVYCARPIAAPLWQALLGFEELQVVGFEQYVEIRRAEGLWLRGVEDGKYMKPDEAGLSHLLRKSGGFVGARALQSS